MTAAAAVPAAVAAAPPADQYGLGDIVKEIVRKKLLGEDESESIIPSGKGHPWWAEGILKLLDNAPAFAGQIAFGIQAARNAAGAPAPPMNGAQQTTNPTPGAPAIAQAQPKQSTPQEQAQMQQIQIFRSLEAPLERALASGQHGVDFAVELIKAQGNPDLYNALSSQTSQQVMAQLQQLQFVGVQLWNVAVRYPQRFEPFLAEFLDRAAVDLKLRGQPAPAPIPDQPQGRPILDPATGTKIRTVSVQPIS